jgi:outer membrane protein assembly factor BamB
MKMPNLSSSFLFSCLLSLMVVEPALVRGAPVQGWFSWRGPQQNGTSLEKGLPNKIDVNQAVWVADFPGQSTPVIANGKVYIMGYSGEGPDLQEGVSCFDAETGKLRWQQGYNDFLSDTIYLRYATSSPTVDPETGQVYMQGTQGILAGFTADGKLLWKHSLMEEYGRLTFPNSRTASPAIDKDLVITRGITANWGANGPAGDRFYAFDKNTGELVWASSPADRPRDNSYSHPYIGWMDGKRVLYSATGDGSVVCVNARTGDPIWRVPLAKAGINATVLVHNNDKVICIYGTPYEPGQMVALRIPHVAPAGPGAPTVVERAQVEIWNNDLSTSTSSPILVGDRIYVVTEKGYLCCVNVQDGKVLWRLNIGIEERNACPLFADRKIYVPILDDPSTKVEGSGEAGTKGGFYVVAPSDTEGKILSHTALEGRCFGTPTAYNGKVYIQTTRHLYCFGKSGANPQLASAPAENPWPKAGPGKELQIVPAEVLLKPGDAVSLRVRVLDGNGLMVAEIKDPKSVQWAAYIPPTARVRAKMNASFDSSGKMVAARDPVPSAGAFEATYNGIHGYMRGRVLPGLPIKQDFESFQLTETTTNSVESPTAFAYPPLPWIGARFKFEVRDKDGTKALTKTIDNQFFQRAFVFMGDPGMKNYTIQADVMSDGNSRKMSEVGVINQRYLIVLKGLEGKLEVNSNLERLRVPASSDPPNFKWSPKVWYRLKARVDTAPDGSGVVRAKAWKRDEPEPAQWTLEVPHQTAHQNGCAGLYGFSPLAQRVFIDNVSVTAND